MDKLLLLDNESTALCELAYHQDINLEQIRGIEMLVGKQED